MYVYILIGVAVLAAIGYGFFIADVTIAPTLTQEDLLDDEDNHYL